MYLQRIIKIKIGSNISTLVLIKIWPHQRKAWDKWRITGFILMKRSVNTALDFTNFLVKEQTGLRSLYLSVRWKSGDARTPNPASWKNKWGYLYEPASSKRVLGTQHLQLLLWKLVENIWTTWHLRGHIGKYMGMTELSKPKLVKTLQTTEKQQQTHQMKHRTNLRGGNSHSQPWPY